MPNLLYMVVSLVYVIALGIWIGGAVALGALVAPELFRRLSRQEAGGLFGPILRRFARLRLVAVAAALAAALTKHFAWESHASSIWLVIRFAALTFLAISVVYEIFGLEPAMAAARQGIAEMADDHPGRQTFMRLHRRSEGLMKISLVVAAAALFVG